MIVTGTPDGTLSGESLAVKVGPSDLGFAGDRVGHWYNRAPILCERNNHGHAVLLWLKGNSQLRRLGGLDGNPGWLSNSRGKAQRYADCADAFRDRTTTLHSFAAFTQLSSIKGNTLRVPEGQ